MNLFDDPLGIHEKALVVRNQRMQVLAANIANADTPNYKAQDLDFKKILADDNVSPMTATNVRHFDRSDPMGSSGIVFRVPYNAPVDGNTVELQVEQAAYGEAAADFQSTLTFLESRISGIRKSLRGE
ncbi:MAG: flagellar basal body rod protein FlgB [Betaproteobacteria bacterium]